MFHRPVIGATLRPDPAPARHRPLVLLLAALLFAACLASAGSPVLAGPVNINAADAATLASELKGVGKVKAQAILEFRQKHGPFRSVDELAQVKGFSQKLIDRNRADIRLGPVGTVAAAATQGARDGVRATPPKAAVVAGPGVPPKASSRPPAAASPAGTR